MAPLHFTCKVAVLVLLLSSPATAVRGRAPPGTTPVQKVIDLLKKLNAQVEADGKKEAAQYDKYACFCKEQADEKLYAIETSQKKIGSLEAQIGELEAEIVVLGQGIADLGQKITQIEGAIASDTTARQQEHEVYLGNEKDARDAIDACERAIAALKESKGQLSGKVKLEKVKLELAQLEALAAVHAQLGTPQLQLLSTLRKGGKQPGQAYDYEYHANDILAELEGLRNKFMEIKAGLDQTEFDSNTLFETKKLDNVNEKKFAEKEKLEKEKLEAYKTELKEEAEAEKTAETNAMNADKEFSQTLQEGCEDKATEWDGRSKTRADELTAIAQALEALETGVVPTWGANRRLNGLQKSQVVRKRALPPSFLQLRGSGAGVARHATQERRALELLSEAAGRLGSPILSVVALRVRAAEDHFEKVRSIIQDLIDRLEAQKAAEATTKSVCDTQIAAETSNRDAKQQEIESLTATMTEKEASVKQLKGEIAEHSRQIAHNTKLLLEATELRADEKQDNLGVIQHAQAGKDEVDFALNVLKEFYEGQVALLQQQKKRGGYVPPNSDREGKTVGDLAPEVFENGYKGRQQASKGIISLLEVILADFSRTDSTVAGREQTAEQDFLAYKKELEDDNSRRQGLKETKEAEVLGLEDALVNLADTKKDAVTAHKTALDALDGLHSMCVAGEETYEERVLKRHKEIEALKEAHAILEDWQN